MGYFSSHYPDFRYPLAADDLPGFRKAQLGAIHSIAGHFAARTDPAVVTMPTGSGKSAVLVSSAFVLRAARVLVLAPSRLVREQLSDELSSLRTLRTIGAIGADVAPPRVLAIRKRIARAEDWEALREYDVVVATVPSVSPEYSVVPEPPRDLFDLVLVDEAHHSPARTWNSVLEHFPGASKVLFTATPFRQDDKEIRGRFVYSYDLRQAFKDGVFGTIRFEPVVPTGQESSDSAIARAAEARLRADQHAGFNHKLMVRTDNLRRAKELLALYGRETGLNLKLVSSQKSLRYCKRAIQDMTSGVLDGIVCVNMLGEGFDFPRLKVAAIHAPHKSLAVTLQFIGRFARTTEAQLGAATFLAVPSEVQIEAERLYDAGAVWQELIQNLSATRVLQETRAREVFESFVPGNIAAQDLSDLSLYSLEPYFHVKVYQLDAMVDLTQPLAFPEPLEVAYESFSRDLNAAVYITREIALPRWTTDARLTSVTPNLFVLFQDAETRLLFVCASLRRPGMYDSLVNALASASPRPLSLVRLNRALNDLAALEFFNIGMRNRVLSSATESYRIITGSNADKSILKSDARLYHRGHMFGRATDDGSMVTIGLSSSSKLWSNKRAKLPVLVEWCEKLARRIAKDAVPITGSGIDYLDVGEEIDALPRGIIAATWPKTVFQQAPMLRFQDRTGVEQERQLLDSELIVDRALSTADAVVLKVVFEETLTYRATYSFETDRFFEPYSTREPHLEVFQQEGRGVDLATYLNEAMPEFYTDDLATVHGYSLFRAPEVIDGTFALEQMQALDWGAASVAIDCECGSAPTVQRSIHEYVEALLREGSGLVAYYDHGSGEIADFINVEARDDDSLLVQLFHCKASSNAFPGHRVTDVYEVQSQAVKSVRWAHKNRILTTIRRRFQSRVGGHRFIKGDLDQLSRILEEAPAARVSFEVVVVQPGIAVAGIAEAMSHILAAASDYLVRGGLAPLKVLASA